MERLQSLVVTVTQPKPGQPIVRLSWEITEWALEEMRRRGVVYPQVLIILTQDHRRERRFLAGLHEQVAQIELHDPGKHEIRVQLFGSDLLSRQAADEQFGQFLQHKSRNRYRESLSAVMNSNHRLGMSERLEVEVAEDQFAKEPPRWLWNWVHWIFPTEQSWDQCEFRRRIIPAFTIQPIFLALWIPFILGIRWIYASLNLVCGRRDIQWGALVRPFRYNTPEVLYLHRANDKAWWTRTNRRGEPRPKWIRVLTEGYFDGMMIFIGCHMVVLFITLWAKTENMTLAWRLEPSIVSALLSLSWMIIISMKSTFKWIAGQLGSFFMKRFEGQATPETPVDPFERRFGHLVAQVSAPVSTTRPEMAAETSPQVSPPPKDITEARPATTDEAKTPHVPEPQRQSFKVQVRLWYLNAKARVCRPFRARND